MRTSSRRSKHFRTSLQRSKRQLASAKAQQGKLVVSLASQKRAIEGRIAAENALVSSLHSEIAHLAGRAGGPRARSRGGRRRPGSTRSARLVERAELDRGRRDGGLSVGRDLRPAVLARRRRQRSPWRRSASRTSGRPPALTRSTARGSSSTRSHSSASRSRIPRTRSGTSECRSPRISSQPGDILFFDGLGHVGMYIGGGEFVQAPHTGTDVQVTPLSLVPERVRRRPPDSLELVSAVEGVDLVREVLEDHLPA